MYEKRRLELIIEKMAARRACNLLEEAGLQGYTVVPTTSGYGGGSHWMGADDLSDARDMVVVIAIGDEERVDRAVAEIGPLLESHVGVVNVSVVQVIRSERF